jgi:glycine/D-amino acid oxidase-like deaminating enzyme
MTDNKTIHRRGVVAGLAGGALAAPALAQVPALPSAPAINRNLPDFVVVGAGAFGGWTALTLRERGAKVTLVDAYGPGNPRGSSGGETRNIRAGYGSREIYSRWATAAWTAWHQRQEEFGRRLIFPNGSLRVPSPTEMTAQRAVFDKLNLPYEMLTPAEVHRRWPQIRFDDADQIFFEKDSGIVKAQVSMVAVAEAFMQKGGEMRIGYATPGAGAGGRLANVSINGETLSAGAYVFATGPWLPKTLPSAMGGKIFAPRRELFFIGAAPEDTRYRWENAPNITDRILYTSADTGSGYKIAPNIRDVPMDPDYGSRLPTPYLLDQVNAYIARRLPGLVGRPVISSYVCQTENTDNGHYVIDVHPEYANAWIAGGGSGHAFKMGPVLGTHVADLALGKPQTPELQAIFGVASHGRVSSERG